MIAAASLLVHTFRVTNPPRFCQPDAAERRATIGDQRGELSFLNELARATYAAGDPAAALQILEEAVSRARIAGERTGLATTLGNCGSVRLELGTDAARAELELLESLDLCRELGLRKYLRSPLYGIIALYYRRNDYPALLVACREFLALELQLGVRPIGLQVVRLLAEALLPTRPLLATDLLNLAAHHPLADAALRTAIERMLHQLPAARRPEFAPTDPDAELQRLLALLP